MSGTPARSKGRKSKGRPARASRGKRALPPGFVDSESLILDGDEDDSQIGTALAVANSLPLSPPITDLALLNLYKLLGVPSRYPLVSGGPKRKRPTKPTLIVTLPLPLMVIDKNASYDPNKTGFMDLPLELRKQIYQDVFAQGPQILVSGRDFSTYYRSSALLRANKAIHNESRKDLYSKNRFLFVPCSMVIVKPYDSSVREMSYSHARQFLEKIGPENTGMLTDIGLLFEDKSQSGNPGVGLEDLRFESNTDLLWILQHLAKFGLRIERLKLGFAGRRRMVPRRNGNSLEFLIALSKIKTDKLCFGDPTVFEDDRTYATWINFSYTKIDERLRDCLSAAMTRPQPWKVLHPNLADY